MEKRVSHKSILNSILYGAITLIIYGCQSPVEHTNVKDKVAEIIYDSTDITVGNQIWMSRNVETVVFRNGDTIYQAKNMSEWLQAGMEKNQHGALIISIQLMAVYMVTCIIIMLL